jgi:hypothetical protein
MFEFFAALIVFALAALAMSIRFLVSGRHFKRRCGGMTNLKKLIGVTSATYACKTPQIVSVGRSLRRVNTLFPVI